MRSQALLLLGGLCLGCAAEHGSRARVTPHEDERDAGDTDQTEEPAEPEPPHEADLAEVLDNFFGGLRAYTKASCSCLAESGEFGSEEECLGSYSNLLSWQDCAARGLGEFDLIKLRRLLSCQANDFYMHAECLNALSCSAEEERIACQTRKLGCPPLDEEIVTALSAACTMMPPSNEGDAD